MHNYDFRWDGTSPLDSVLKQSIKAVSLTMRGITPGALTLWHAGGSLLDIYTEMIDLDEHREAGVLVFEEVYQVPPYQHIIRFDANPLEIKNVHRLIVEEDGDRLVEAGIILEALDHKPISIIAGSFPCSLAIDGLFDFPRVFDTEYEMDAYVRLEFRGHHT